MAVGWRWLVPVCGLGTVVTSSPLGGAGPGWRWSQCPFFLARGDDRVVCAAHRWVALVRLARAVPWGGGESVPSFPPGKGHQLTAGWRWPPGPGVLRSPAPGVPLRLAGPQGRAGDVARAARWRCRPETVEPGSPLGGAGPRWPGGAWVAVSQCPFPARKGSPAHRWVALAPGGGGVVGSPGNGHQLRWWRWPGWPGAGVAVSQCPFPARKGSPAHRWVALARAGQGCPGVAVTSTCPFAARKGSPAHRRPGPTTLATP